ncbi:hypothetical protein COW38_00330 [Candidatus Collierbacteria bacterium CG17_big_fil_post_rev_8_21_14_2_50_45_7]|uniref:YgjP-like metallopeptidase domain-containing protein n=2 Tax=Candidatus Collieribacteriota TaxID=1752725 RepID=A0A2M7FRV9_9BACT|nr:MAG: hypothetical protein COW38_00330 [Candidatus Collierbacteria bacterium CG17_big_fil_post_rev_8_21_14_2_50_45_7]
MNYTLIRSRKLTLSLQVNAQGQLIARAPLYMPKFMVDHFVKAKSTWISKRQKELKQPVAPKVAHFSESSLQVFIQSEVAKYSALMGLTPSGLRYTHVHSYWGTCAPSRLLSFNMALIYTPKEAVSYVVVHELAHLRWRGHGLRFWALVKKYFPATPSMRKLLRHLPYVVS